MSLLKDEYLDQIVTVYIKNPHEVMPYSKIVQNLFGKFLGQRFHSYNGNYKRSFPFGAEDFFSNHVLTCLRTDGELIPLTSMKIVTLEQCQQYNAEFPLFHTLKSSDNELQNNTRKMVNECELVGKVGYIGCRTLNPSFKYDKKIRTFLRDSLSLYCLEGCRDMRITDIFITSTIPNGAYRHHHRLGFINLTDKKVIIRDLDHTESYLQYLSEWSEHVKETAALNRHYWDKRIEISIDNLEEDLHAA